MTNKQIDRILVVAGREVRCERELIAGDADVQRTHRPVLVARPRVTQLAA